MTLEEIKASLKRTGGTLANAFSKTGIGKAATVIGGAVAPNFTPVSSLKNSGGNPNMPFKWVPQAQAAEKDPYANSQSFVDPYADSQSFNTNTISPTGGTSLLSGGDGSGSGDTGTQSFSDIAQAQYIAAKNAILSRLQMMKDEANRLRGEAQKGFDFTKGEIGKNYGALKELSGKKLQEALGLLTQEDTNVQNTYGRTAGNSRRAMESALTRNRMLSRAMGNLGSSFYQDSQADTTNQGMNTINDVAVEESGKRAAIGSRKSATGIDFATNDVAIGAEEAKLNQDAVNKYNTDVANANMLERDYNIDSTEAIAQANNTLDSALATIREYALNKVPTSGSTYSNLSTSLPKYDAISPIKDTLNTSPAIDASKTYLANAASTGTGAPQSVSYSSPTYLSQIKKRLTDPNQYYVNA